MIKSNKFVFNLYIFKEKPDRYYMYHSCLSSYLALTVNPINPSNLKHK